MGWLGDLLGSGKFVDKVSDAAIATGDKLFFTEEEKSDANKKVLDWYLKYLQVTNPQNVARRIIAFFVTALWTFLILTAVTFRYFGDVEFSGFVFDVLKTHVNTPFSIVIGFYFATHLLRGARKD